MTQPCIGLEDDGHILAEGANVKCEYSGDHGGAVIYLQKQSYYNSGRIEITGDHRYAVAAYSGSKFHAGLIGAMGLYANTFAAINTNLPEGAVLDPEDIVERNGGRIILR